MCSFPLSLSKQGNPSRTLPSFFYRCIFSDLIFQNSFLIQFHIGSVLVALAKAYPDATIRALIRPSIYQSKPIFDAVKALGAEPVSCSLRDYALVASLASEADIVVNVADSDDFLLIEAILESFKKRKEGGKSVASFIQTSGTMIFLDGNTEGKFDSKANIWTV